MSGKVHATPAPEKPVSRPGGFKYDAFLTHDWGKDEHDRSNHARVGQVNEALKARGVVTWFDEEKMEGNVVEQMVAGIDDSAVCVVFVTKRYMEKVAQRENPNDNCKREFGYSVRKKTANRIVTVVMEARMRNSGSWEGAVGMELGGQLYHDLSGEGELVDDSVIASIAEEIIRMRDKDTSTHSPVQQEAAPPHASSGIEEFATLLRNAELESCIAPLLAFGRPETLNPEFINSAKPCILNPKP
jgi:hypothetical protein